MLERLKTWLFGPPCVYCGKRHGSGREVWLEYGLCEWAHTHLTGSKRARFMED